MDKMIIGRAPEILIDSCPRGDGLWFDGGELDELIGELTDETGAGGRVASFLGQALGSGKPRT